MDYSTAEALLLSICRLYLGSQHHCLAPTPNSRLRCVNRTWITGVDLVPRLFRQLPKRAPGRLSCSAAVAAFSSETQSDRESVRVWSLATRDRRQRFGVVARGSGGLFE